MTLGLVGLVVILLSLVLMLVLTMLQRKVKPTFRQISAFSRLQREIGYVVENGKRLHFSLGRANVADQQSASALAGLLLLRRLAEMTSSGDKPPIATSGDATLAILSQDALLGASHISSRGSFDPTRARLSGLTPFSYAAGAIMDMRDENVCANVLMGHFGSESALMVEAAARENAFVLAGSDELTAQAILYAGARETLIGEELFSSGAYMGSQPLEKASLTLQDILRWLIIISMLAGGILTVVGIL
jgi:hypothetical protein